MALAVAEGGGAAAEGGGAAAEGSAAVEGVGVACAEMLGRALGVAVRLGLALCAGDALATGLAVAEAPGPGEAGGSVEGLGLPGEARGDGRPLPCGRCDAAGLNETQPLTSTASSNGSTMARRAMGRLTQRARGVGWG